MSVWSGGNFGKNKNKKWIGKGRKEKEMELEIGDGIFLRGDRDRRGEESDWGYSFHCFHASFVVGWDVGAELRTEKSEKEESLVPQAPSPLPPLVRPQERDEMRGCWLADWAGVDGWMDVR